MKYVLVIDVPEPMESEDVRIDYLCYFNFGDNIESEYGAMLKPLPQERDEHCRYDDWGIESIINSENRGFNKCLKEITE